MFQRWFNVDVFAGVLSLMSRNKFDKIMQKLHLGDNSTQAPWIWCCNYKATVPKNCCTSREWSLLIFQEVIGELKVSTKILKNTSE